MARTYDVMKKMAIAAKPDAAADFHRDLVGALDRHFPIKGGWRAQPLAQGEKLLRDVIADKP
jgi:hypothetical protein